MAVPKPFVLVSRALNNGLYRASGGRMMGKVRGMPVLLITVPGRKTVTRTPRLSRISRTMANSW
jgi:hypothetical protein